MTLKKQLKIKRCISVGKLSIAAQLDTAQQQQ